MKTKISSIIISLLLLSCSTTVEQRQFMLKTIKGDQELRQNIVYAITPGQKSFLRVATTVVLHGFNSHNLQIYKHEHSDKNSLTDDNEDDIFLKGITFWRNWWFYLLCFIAGVSSLCVFIKFRINSIKKRRQELERMVNIRTKQLIEEKDRAQSYLDIAGVMIVVIDGNQKVLQINKRGCSILGYPENVIVGKNWFDLCIHPQKIDKIRTYYENLITGEFDPLAYYESVILTKNGEERIIAWHNSILKDEKGNIVGTLNSGEDITERKRGEQIQEVLSYISQATSMSRNLEELLKLIHQQLGLLIDTGNFYVALYEPATNQYSFPFSVNEKNEQIDASQMQIQRNLIDYVRKTGAPLLVDEDVFQELVDKGKIEFTDTQVPTWLGVPLTTTHGVIGVASLQNHQEKSSFSDDDLELMTFVSDNIALSIERKRAEEALAAEKELLAVTLRLIGDGVISTCTEGRIILMNKVAEKLTGWKEAEAIGKSINEVFHIINEKTQEHCLNPVEQVIKSGKIIELANHTVLIAKDGTELVIADSGAPIRDDKSVIIGVVLVFRDITEQRKIGEELLKATKLESIGMLAGGIAHDFNNILTAITGNISLAKAITNPKKEIYEMITDIEKASLRASDLTQQLLTFSKGGVPIKKTALIADLIKNSVTFTLRGSNVRCKFSFPGDLWAVDVDEGQMIQVVNNLIINADQSMHEGGVIQVCMENAVLSTDHVPPLKKGNYIKISITDHGEGIPDEYIHKIFDPYFTTKQQGSGLGLATSYSIVNKHDGYIAAESEVGVGTTFYVYLPASPKEIPSKNEEQEILHQGKGKVLIMDDEEVIRKIAVKMIRHLGYQADFTKDGAETIELYQQAQKDNKPFDVIIMDLTIPGSMGGREALEKLVQIDPEVKAVVSSGYSTDPVMANFRQYGFCDYITKP